MASQAKAFKAAVFSACQGLYTDPILVSYGWPKSNPPELVVVGDVVSVQELGPQSPQRRREELLTIDISVCVFQGGVVDQQPVTERAYDLVALLENYLQDSGTVASLQATLGNTVRTCQVSGHELVESDDEEVLAKGRAATITATLTASVRI
jgi:hypothetical protein